MGDVALTLLTLLMLQLLAAVAWMLGAARLDLPRREAMHWGGASLLSAAVLGLVLARDVAPLWLTTDLSRLLGVAALLATQRGLLLFLHCPARDREAVAVLVVLAAATVAVARLPVETATQARIALNCAAMLWVLSRTAMQCWPALRKEYGEGTAFAIIAPHLAGASLFGVRLASFAVLPFAGMRLLPEDTAFNVAMALVLLLVCVLLQGSLGAAVALRTVGQLRRLSQHDALTGLFNRAEWTRRLEAQHRWLGRFGEPFALLMIDVDHFKAINDTLGHAAGDAVLIGIARVLTSSAREIDVIGRIGGEEFCVLLPRADPGSARRIAERLRTAIADAEITWHQNTIRVTVSVGLAIVTEPDETPQQMLDRADKALYQSKRTGRNRTSMARPVAR